MSKASGMSTSSDDSTAILLYGTAEPVLPMRTLAAGALTAELDRGNIRYVRWGGLEVLRAISFVVRDTRWGTYDPVVTGLAVEETSGRFVVRYRARCDGGEGAFAYDAVIVGTDDGRLVFHAEGASETGFATNRTGFVVLHPLKGAVGHAVDVTHTTGERSTVQFPKLISPGQPIFDIRSLRHSPTPGVTVKVLMEGDTFEMEDHRNWTDASFKTYVRPLALGFPYRIETGHALDQRVTLTVEGPPAPRAKSSDTTTVRLGKAAGPFPQVGLVVFDAVTALARTKQIAGLNPSYLVARVDGRGDLADLTAVADLARVTGLPLALDIVIAGNSPGRELARVTDAAKRVGISPEAVFVIPARDLRSRPANQIPPGEASAEEILAEARQAFPSTRIGGGMPVGFTELNRNRPAPGIDFVTHSTQATVHAADDVSVMETLEALPDVVRSTRAIVGKIPYRLGLATIGAPVETYFATPAVNPENRRITQPAVDPRQRGLFAAAFAIGYAAVASKAGVDALTLAAATGSAGAFSPEGRPSPLGEIVGRLAELAGVGSIEVSIDGDARVAGLSADGTSGPILWLANLSGVTISVAIEGRSFTTIWRMDTENLMRYAPDEIPTQGLIEKAVKLGPYAVCRLAGMTVVAS